VRPIANLNIDSIQRIHLDAFQPFPVEKHHLYKGHEATELDAEEREERKPVTPLLPFLARTSLLAPTSLLARHFSRRPVPFLHRKPEMGGKHSKVKTAHRTDIISLLFANHQRSNYRLENKVKDGNLTIAIAAMRNVSGRGNFMLS